MKNNYRISQYFDFETVSPDNTVVWSGLTGFIGVFPNNIAKNIACNNLTILSKHTIKTLLNNGILINKKIDEQKYLLRIVSNNKKNFHKKINGLSIILTRNCNCVCTYCYQKNENVLNRKKAKNKVDINNIKKIIKYALKYGNHSNFTVRFFGGEPLINFKAINIFVNKFRELSKSEFFANINFGLTTNGLLIDETFLNIFRKQNDLKDIQFTLDGLEDNHNEVRKLRNGNGTYNKIWYGIEKILDVANSIKIRINVRRNNKKDIIPLTKLILKHFPNNKVIPYLAPIQSYNQSKIEVLSPIEYWDILEKFYKYYFEIIGIVHPDLNMNKKYIACLSPYSLPQWVDMDNKLYQCQHQPDININESGLLDSNGNIIDFNDLSKNSLDTINTKCINCTLFSFCGGGCINNNFMDNKLPFHCDYLRNQLVTSAKYKYFN